LNASIRTVQRPFANLGFDYKSVPKQIPPQRSHNKSIRVELARKWISEVFFRKNVVFSDEKRICLDGPDN